MFNEFPGKNRLKTLLRLKVEAAERLLGESKRLPFSSNTNWDLERGAKVPYTKESHRARVHAEEHLLETVRISWMYVRTNLTCNNRRQKAGASSEDVINITPKWRLRRKSEIEPLNVISEEQTVQFTLEGKNNLVLNSITKLAKNQPVLC